MGSCNFPALCRNWCPVFQRPRLNQLRRSHKRPVESWSGKGASSQWNKAWHIMTPSYKWQLERWLSFVGLCWEFPRKLASSFDCLGRGETKYMTHLIYFPSTTKHGSGSGPIAIQYAGPVSNLDRYASILRQQGRCRNGWWGQCQDPDQGATRHCDVRDSVSFTFPWNGPYFSNISTVHILGSSIQVAKGWCILWSFEK